MSKRIRITRTEVFEYTPDLTQIAYEENNVTTVEQAFALDKKDVEDDSLYVTTLIQENEGKTISTELKWELVDD